MKSLVVTALLATSSLAFAHDCPNAMKAIDAKIAANPAVAAADLAKAKTLRADGEKLHKEGKHDDSMKALGEAKKLLGV